MTIRASLSTLPMLIIAGVCTPASISAPDNMAESGHSPEFSIADVTAAPGELPAVWTFNDCVDWAISNTTDIRRNILDVLRAQQDVYAAKDAWLPTVGFSTSQSYTNYPVPAASQKGNIYGSNYGVKATRFIFITAYDRYALDGYRVNALDYLLKPVSYPEFMRDVAKAME